MQYKKIILILLSFFVQREILSHIPCISKAMFPDFSYRSSYHGNNNSIISITHIAKNTIPHFNIIVKLLVVTNIARDIILNVTEAIITPICLEATLKRMYPIDPAIQFIKKKQKEFAIGNTTNNSEIFKDSNLFFFTLYQLNQEEEWTKKNDPPEQQKITLTNINLQRIALYESLEQTIKKDCTNDQRKDLILHACNQQEQISALLQQK